MFEREAPVYSSGFAAILVCLGVSILLIIALRFYLIWQNKKRGSVEQVVDTGDLNAEQMSAEDIAAMDKTDWETDGFCYVY